MTKWTQKFLLQLKKPAGHEPSNVRLQRNAGKAERTLSMPKELWIELSREANLFDSSWVTSVSTIFMAGVAVGWKERTDHKSCKAMKRKPKPKIKRLQAQQEAVARRKAPRLSPKEKLMVSMANERAEWSAWQTRGPR